MAKVELKGVTKVYDGDVLAVESSNVTIEDQEFCVFVGPSGCGKSTTLRMIAGLEDITEGELLIDGKLMNDIPPKDRDIAMVFQNYALYPHMTVYDNMAFGLKIRKTDKAEIERRVKEASHILNLDDYLTRKPKALSGGQRQRVAVGRAIVRSPKVFLFDEPLSNLDAKLRVQMRAEISDLHHRLNATMIYVTHDQVEAMTMGTKIVVMSEKRIQQIGEPLYLYNHPINKFVAGFIGTPPMNFFMVTISDENGKITAKVKTSSDESDANSIVLVPTENQQKYLKNYAGKDVWFGVRPEDLVYQESAAAENNMAVKVTNKEPLGAETHVFVQVSNVNVVAKCSPKVNPNLGETINFTPKMEKCKFFDVDTEVNICEPDIEKKW